MQYIVGLITQGILHRVTVHIHCQPVSLYGAVLALHHPKQKCFDDLCILFALVSKQLICHDLNLFQLESQKFEIKSEITSRSF